MAKKRGRPPASSSKKTGKKRGPKATKNKSNNIDSYLVGCLNSMTEDLTFIAKKIFEYDRKFQQVVFERVDFGSLDKNQGFNNEQRSKN